LFVSLLFYSTYIWRNILANAPKSYLFTILTLRLNLRVIEKEFEKYAIVAAEKYHEE